MNRELKTGDTDKALFLFSKHCHGCKLYGKDYENLALSYLKQENPKIKFYRMNNDKNNWQFC